MNRPADREAIEALGGHMLLEGEEQPERVRVMVVKPYHWRGVDLKGCRADLIRIGDKGDNKVFVIDPDVRPDWMKRLRAHRAIYPCVIPSDRVIILDADFEDSVLRACMREQWAYDLRD